MQTAPTTARASAPGSDPRRGRLVIDLIAIVAGWLCLVVVDAVAAGNLHPKPPLRVAFGFPLFAVWGLAEIAWPSFVLALVLIVPTSRSPRALAIGMGALAAAVFTAYVRATLFAYEPFRRDLAMGVGVSLFGLALFVLFLVTHVSGDERHWLSRLRQLSSASAILAGLSAQLLNYFLYPAYYPTLHLSLTLMAAALVFVGFVGVARWASFAKRRQWLFGVPLLATSTLAAGELLPSLRPYFLQHSQIGRLQPSSEDLNFERLSGERLRAATSDDPDALRRFRSASHYPDLPADFRLERYNVLLIGADTTRFMDTSLAEAGPDTTPFLKRAAQRGFVATRAFAPSSGTLHSMSALLTMKYPSAIDLTTWMQPWCGELSTKETTVAELFSSAQYDTFWIGHTNPMAFGRAILGFDQGFQDIQLVAEDGEGEAAQVLDERIASLSVAKLEQLATTAREGAAAKRFFGWVFFGGPHAPYLTHGLPGLPELSDHDRYLQEIGNVDRQLERVFRALERLKLLDDTVVVFFSDHGEEFREHGGTKHKTTVYSESLRVPLVVWAPGLPPSAMDVPTSTLYLFPWLLSASDQPELRGAVEETLRKLIGPMLRETGGAVVAEMIGHDRNKSTLVYPGRKLNYDYRSGLSSVFDIEQDPTEQRDLSFVSNSAGLMRHLAGYDAVRESRRNYRFLPDKVAPPRRRAPKTPRQQTRALAGPASDRDARHDGSDAQE